MKVVIVRDRESSGGGIFNYYAAIERYLTVEVVFAEVGRPHHFYGKQHQSLFRFTLWRLIRDWAALLLRIVRFRPDIVHVNPGLDVSTFRSLRRDAVNVLIARALGRRVLVFWRGWENHWYGEPEFPGGTKGILGRIYKLASGHIVLSERSKEDLVRWGFEAPIHVETTVVGDDCLSASCSPQTPRICTRLLYLSRVEVGKGVFELLDAYKILKTRDSDYTLTIAGDGPELEALRGHAVNLGLSDLTFTGFLTGEAKVNCYREGGIFCFLSYTEGMPNAVLEALAMGLPVVSSDAGGLRDILRDGENGFIVRPVNAGVPRKMFDRVEVANAIERLAKNPDLYRRVAGFNRQYARERFAAPVVAKRLEKIYSSVMTNEPVRSSSDSEPVSSACVE